MRIYIVDPQILVTMTMNLKGVMKVIVLRCLGNSIWYSILVKKERKKEEGVIR